MKSNNVAYSQEYREYRKKFEYVFQDRYKKEVNKIALLDGKYTIQITSYTDDSYELNDYQITV